MTDELKTNGKRKRVLVVAYGFPPVGGAGVQRATKFVKWLSDFGWEPTVLTVANPSVPVLDHTLELDVPPTVTVLRARTHEPSYALKSRLSGSDEPSGPSGRAALRLVKRAARRAVNWLLQPDPQVLWYPAAVRRGKEALQRVKHDAIFVTAPPFSSFLVGVRLARFSGLPLVLDYRDEWGISNRYWENRSAGLWARWVQSVLQRRVVRAADALVATTEASRQTLAELAAAVGSTARSVCIYNGFDRDDFRWPSGRPPSDRFRLAYVGTLWNLTSVEPLVRAVRTLSRRQPKLAAKLELVFAGRRTAAQDALLSQLADTPCPLHRLPYLEHAEAVDLMLSADGLCLLLADVPDADRVVPGKLFEYLATGKPVLFVGPQGETWRLLEPYAPAARFRPRDTDAIADALGRLVQAKFNARAEDTEPSASEVPEPAGGLRTTQYVEQFERRALTGQLARLLDEVVEQRRGRPASRPAQAAVVPEPDDAHEEAPLNVASAHRQREVPSGSRQSAVFFGHGQPAPARPVPGGVAQPGAERQPDETPRRPVHQPEPPAQLGHATKREEDS